MQAGGQYAASIKNNNNVICYKGYIVKSSKKAYISLLMSAFLMSGIVASAYIGILDFTGFMAMPNYIKAAAFTAVFLALFLFIFFLVNIKRGSSKKKKKASGGSADSHPADVTRHQGGLLAAGMAVGKAAGKAAASRLPAQDGETSGQDVIYEEDGVPYINSGLAKKSAHGTLNRNFIKLVESVTGS